MGEDVLFDVLREGLWVGVTISTPILVAALVAGVAVGLFQALTSVQEMTLTFVPKLGVMIVVFWASMGFMTQTLVDFFKGSLIPMIAGS
jgi:flagellar biosynthetic protein FliQ